MFCRLCFGLLIAMVMMPYHSAFAVDHTIRNLAVDVEAETAIQAREEALSQARRNAFNVLKKRFPTPIENILTPDPATIATMVDSFEINREKLSKNRYLASVNVTFNERAVQTYIAQSTGGGMYGNRANNSDFDRVLGAVATGDEFQNTRQNALTPSTQSVIRIPIAGVRQWIGIKKSLQSVYSIQNIEIKEISSRRAVVNLSHQGSIYDLQNVLIGRGMRLYANTDSARQAIPYILVTRG